MKRPDLALTLYVAFWFTIAFILWVLQESNVI